MHLRRTSGVGLKRDDNKNISLHNFSSFPSSISFNLLSFSSRFLSILSCLLLSFPFPVCLSPPPPYHIFNLSTLLCLLFVPSLMCFSPPASCLLLCSRVWVSIAYCLASSFMPDIPSLCFIPQPHWLSVLFIYLFIPPTPPTLSLPLCLSVSRGIRFIYIQPVTSAMEIY